jgi:DNA polymerase III psi subunit
MSLDNIQLPGFIIQDLYQKSLVDLNNSESKNTAKSKEINYFGGNKQHIILLVKNADAVFINDEQLTFLSGILTACKLTIEDIALVNIVNLSSLSYKLFIDEFKPKIFLLFGVSPDEIQLPFVMPYFQKQSYNNVLYLSSPALNEVEANKDLKRQLWEVLKQIFFSLICTN